jgi:hypothetical protein
MGKHVPAATSKHAIIDNPVPGEYKYGGLALQVRIVLNLRQ